MNIQFNRYPRGLSMVELVVATAIIGLALIPVFGLFTEIYRTADVSIEELNGTNLCSELLDAVAGLPYDEIPVFNDLPVEQALNDPNYSEFLSLLKIGPGVDGIERYLTVEEIELGLIPPAVSNSQQREYLTDYSTVKVVQVRAIWTPLNEREREVFLARLVPNYYLK